MDRERLGAGLVAVTLVAGCVDGVPRSASSTAAGDSRPADDPGAILFEDRAASSGLDFVHRNGAAGSYFLPEIMGAGAALVDVDADGDLDVFLVQGEDFDPGDGAGRDANRTGDRLFRNELSETGVLRFTDVSTAAGFGSGGYGMGVAAADMDADGQVDLYVTNVGSNRLWRNTGGGRFEDVTEAAGVGDAAWSVPAVFLDADRDGDLDLFVGNYVEFNRGAHTACASAGGGLDYCSPRSFAAVPDRYYRNRGGGRFEEAGSAAGLAGVHGYALGSIAVDADADGLPDLYVANDWSPNQLWLNRGGRFDEGARFAGVAVNASGVAEAGMGVDAADFDGDGDEDVIVTHLTGETNTLYRNDGDGMFTDASLVSRLGPPSLPWTGFGAGWIDYDNDGLLDFLVVNGAVRGQGGAGDLGFGQPNQLFRNLGEGRFEEVSAAVGPAFVEPLTSRGAAFGDVDNDGDVDVLVTNNAGPAQLLINLVGQDRAWIGLRAVDPDPERDALGSLVEVRLGGGRSLVRRVKVAGSYASSSDPRVIFGLGDAEGVAEVRVRWLGGPEESFGPLAIRRYHTLRRGEGAAVR